MTLSDLIFDKYAMLSEDAAERLSRGPVDQYAVEVKPPRTGDVPEKLTRFVDGIREYQSKWLKTRNISPVTAFEIRRPNPGNLRFQFAAESRRMEREIRNSLFEEVPSAEFDSGVHGLPISTGDSVGGGYLTLGRPDWLPLKMDYSRPLTDSLAASLDGESMRDTRFVVQVLFQPAAGDRVRRWWWRRQAHREANYLRDDNVSIWTGNQRSPSQRERDQAKLIRGKVGSPRFHCSIRVLVIGAGEYTASRVKEVATAFNVAESSGSGQYFDLSTVKSWRDTPFIGFAEAVSQRRFMGRLLRFQLSKDELAGLVALPSIDQRNINYS